MIPNPFNPLPYTYTQLLAPLMLSTTHRNSAEYIELIIQAELFVAKNVFRIAKFTKKSRYGVFSQTGLLRLKTQSRVINCASLHLIMIKMVIYSQSCKDLRRTLWAICALISPTTAEWRHTVGCAFVCHFSITSAPVGAKFYFCPAVATRAKWQFWKGCRPLLSLSLRIARGHWCETDPCAIFMLKKAAHVPRNTDGILWGLCSGANAPNSSRLRERYDYFLVPRIPLMNPTRA
jgi:hypothetical protein